MTILLVTLIFYVWVTLSKNWTNYSNADLKNLVNWLKANKISLNVKKAEMEVFKSKLKTFESDLKIGLFGKRLYPPESFK